jgi:uncharacterized protein
LIVPDTNLLIFAYDSTSPHHAAARAWWEDALSSDEPIGIPWVVVLAFTRLMTHPTICADPLSVEEVRHRVDQWFGQRHVRLLSPVATTMQTFYDLLTSAGLGGNLTTDALIAAHAREHDAVVYSNDFDFSRFPALKWKNPLTD